MTSGFLSHSKKDRDVAVKIHQGLEDAGYEDIFLDEHPDGGLHVGRDWVQGLHVAMRRADFVLYLMTPNSRASQWCHSELCLAQSFGLEIVPIVVEGDSVQLLPEVLGNTLAARLEVGDPSSWEQFLERLATAGFAPSEAAGGPRTKPYPGMRAFGIGDAWAYFGRDAQTRELVARLRSTGRSSRALLVMGPSGVGKSSLVSAGVLSRLVRTGWVAWNPLLPGMNPTSALADLIRATATDRQVGGIDALDLGSAEGIAAAAGAFLAEVPPDRRREVRTVLHIDQGEELFTLCAPEETTRFLDLIASTIDLTDDLSVVLSMRSEYLTKLLKHPGAERFEASPAHVHPLSSQALAEAISKPAKAARLEVDDALPSTLGREVEEGSALPLMAHVLHEIQELAEERGERRLTLAMYDEVGGIKGAVTMNAERAMADLQDVPLKEATRALLSLVTMDEETGIASRRRASIGEATPAQVEILRAFEQQKLLTAQDDLTGPTISVAHEALLRSWEPLQEQIEAARELLQMRRRIERARRDWESLGSAEGDLLETTIIRRAQRLLEGGSSLVALDERDRQFLVRSAAVRGALADDLIRDQWAQDAAVVCHELLASPLDRDQKGGCRLAAVLPPDPSRAERLVQITRIGSEDTSVDAAMALARIGEVRRMLDHLSRGEFDRVRGSRLLAHLRNEPSSARAVLGRRREWRGYRVGWNSLKALVTTSSAWYLGLAGKVFITAYIISSLVGTLGIPLSYGGVSLTLVMCTWALGDRRQQIDGRLRGSTSWLIAAAGFLPDVVPALVSMIVVLSLYLARGVSNNASDPMQILADMTAMAILLPGLIYPLSIRGRGGSDAPRWSDPLFRRRTRARLGLLAGVGAALSMGLQMQSRSIALFVGVIGVMGSGLLVAVIGGIVLSDLGAAEGALLAGEPPPQTSLVDRFVAGALHPLTWVVIGLAAAALPLSVPVTADQDDSDWNDFCGSPIPVWVDARNEIPNLEEDLQEIIANPTPLNEQNQPVFGETTDARLADVQADLSHERSCRDAAARALSTAGAYITTGLAVAFALLVRRRRVRRAVRRQAQNALASSAHPDRHPDPDIE